MAARWLAGKPSKASRSAREACGAAGRWSIVPTGISRGPLKMGQGRATSPVQADGLAHHDPVEPRPQRLGITKAVTPSPGLLERGLDGITRLTAVQADEAGQADKAAVVLADEGIEACGIECQARPRDGVPSSVRGQLPLSLLLALNHRGRREAFRVNLRR